MERYLLVLILVSLCNQILADSPDCSGSVNGKRFLDPSDCSSYYICIQHTTVKNQCPYGFFYNSQKEICSDPRLIDSSEQCYFENLCSKKLNGFRFAYPDCRWYYLCVNRKTILNKCPDGMHLNLAENICSIPQKIKNGECARSRCYGLPDGTRFPHSDCEKFYFCYEGEESVKDCKQGLHYNPVQGYCEEPAKAGCEKQKCYQQPDGTLIPHKECEKFYFCYKEETTVRQCKYGLDFNAKKQFCEEPAKAGCEESRCIGRPDGTQFPYRECDKFYFCFKEKISVRKCLDGLHFNPMKGFCENPEIAGCQKAKCYGEPNGVLLPHQECNKFYFCFDGTDTIRNCKEGLHYNAKLGFCQEPEKAGCILGI